MIELWHNCLRGSQSNKFNLHPQVAAISSFIINQLKSRFIRVSNTIDLLELYHISKYQSWSFKSCGEILFLFKRREHTIRRYFKESSIKMLIGRTIDWPLKTRFIHRFIQSVSYSVIGSKTRGGFFIFRCS